MSHSVARGVPSGLKKMMPGSSEQTAVCDKLKVTMSSSVRHTEYFQGKGNKLVQGQIQTLVILFELTVYTVSIENRF